MSYQPKTYGIVEKAPWSEDQIKALNKLQKVSEHNAFKCKNDHIFTATTTGWVCSKCSDTQDWCFGETLTI